jgi:undecaprenyl-diphosphatase
MRGRRRETIFVVVALAGSLIVNETMKLFFHRPRPVLAWAHVQPDYSFPSGHSMNSLVLGLALAIVVWRLAGVRPGVVAVAGAIVLSLLIGLSRIYLGYHYFTDVVAGFAAGILWVAIVVAVFRGGDVWHGRRHPASRAQRRGRAIRLGMFGVLFDVRGAI